MAALHGADEAHIKREMEAMGVECIEPAGDHEVATAALMDAFATFVLEEQPRRSLDILEENHDGSVGELQGGNEHAIYRVEITDDEESVVSRLLRNFGGGLTVGSCVETSTPSSRRIYGDNIASMAWGP
jgi:hypothetical protein